jgi:hypothetical protein
VLEQGRIVIEVMGRIDSKIKLSKAVILRVYQLNHLAISKHDIDCLALNFHRVGRYQQQVWSNEMKNRLIFMGNMLGNQLTTLCISYEDERTFI